MTRLASAIPGNSRQRGFWLRCFLSNAFLAAALMLAASSPSWAKVESQGAIHIWRLHGVLVDPQGQPLENVQITLLRDGKVAGRTQTDGSGEFAFDHVYGHYRLHIAKSSYSELDREVVVGIETADLRRKTLYVIAGPGACMDDCSSVFFNKNEFQKAIRRSTEHHY